METNYALRKWIHPESKQALEEHLERIKEEDEEKRKKLIEHKKNMAGFKNQFTLLGEAFSGLKNFIDNEKIRLKNT